MGKRMTKAEASAWGVLIIIAAPIVAIGALYQAVGPYAFFGTIVAGLALFVWYKWHQGKTRDEEARAAQAAEAAAREARRTYLVEKYGDTEIVEKIMAGKVWQGQTAAQLRDSLGNPADTDERVMKTKRREVWKYGQVGRNRFAIRITLEQDIVVGWDEKA